jgi:Tfp pilus assembly protein PilP
MKRTMTILVGVLAAGLAGAQNPQIIQNTKATMDGVRDRATAASNEALGAKAAATKGTPAAAKPSAVHAPAQAAGAASAAAKTSPAARSTATAKPGAVKVSKRAPQKKAVLSAAQPVAVASPSKAAASQPSAANSDATEAAASGEKKPEKWSMNGKRDPFVSPVVSQGSGSGCTTGKKCLEIGAINLRGVVRSENGFIAVVTNSVNKAYFLRENDPVFDGYVVKITGDSVVFQETLQDRLGKTFTREVVKKITTPAV